MCHRSLCGVKTLPANREISELQVTLTSITLKDLKGSENFQNKVFLSQGDDVKSALLVLAGANSRLLSQTPHGVLQVKQPYFNVTVHFNIQIILARRRDARPPENISTFPPALHLLQTDEVSSLVNLGQPSRVELGSVK